MSFWTSKPLFFSLNKLTSGGGPSLKFNTSENSEQIAIAPKSGLLTIFPSHIVHYTAPNRNDDFRITVSGNIMVSGQIGSYDELTYLNTKENKWITSVICWNMRKLKLNLI